MNCYEIEIYTLNGTVFVHTDAANLFCARAYAEKYVQLFVPNGTILDVRRESQWA